MTGRDGPLRMAAIGADLGGTKVAAVVLAEDGRVGRGVRRAHDGTADGAVSTLIALLEELTASSPPGALGIAAAGLVDRRRGVLVHSALLGIRDLPLAATLAARIGVDVRLENDANATLEGIRATRADDGVTVLLTLGTGVGGAVSIGDRPIDGAFGFAAELGHLPVEPPGLHACPCGSSGCLELVASGTAVARAARAAGLPGVDGRPPRAEDVVAAARAGDPTAAAVLDVAGTAIGTALAVLVPVLDPGTVYLAGGFGHAAAAHLIPAAERRLRAQIPFPRSRPAPRILRDPVGPLAAAIGAARLAGRRTPTPL